MLTRDDDPRVMRDSLREMRRAVKCKGQKRFGVFLEVHGDAFTTWHRRCTAPCAGGTHMQVRRKSSIAIAVGFALLALACGGSTTSPTTPSSIAVSGAAPIVGSTAQFTATATMSDGTTQDVTSQATWQSSDAAIATVSATGAVTGVGAGTASVTATYQSVAGSDQITVIAQ